MYAWVFILALSSGEVFTKTFDTRAQCEDRLRVAARSEGVADAVCVRVPWRTA